MCMTTSAPESGTSVPPDEVLSAVANEQRRAVLRSLNRTEGETMEFNTLTDQVAEHVRDGGLPDDEHRQRIHIALHHIHLPQLEDCGMIVNDTETDQVRIVNGELSKELLMLVDAYEAGE